MTHKIISEQDIEALFGNSELCRPRFKEVRHWIENWFNSLPSAQGEAYSVTAWVRRGSEIIYLPERALITDKPLYEKSHQATVAPQLPPDAKHRSIGFALKSCIDGQFYPVLQPSIEVAEDTILQLKERGDVYCQPTPVFTYTPDAEKRIAELTNAIADHVTVRSDQQSRITSLESEVAKLKGEKDKLLDALGVGKEIIEFAVDNKVFSEKDCAKCERILSRFDALISDLRGTE